MNDQQILLLQKRNAGLKKKLADKTSQLRQKNRELEIEAALEKVRARTMAMQKSDELSETVYVLFQQFKELGENPDQATIGIVNEDEKVIEYWVTMYGNPINKVFKFSLDEPTVTNKIYKAWKENKKSLMIDLSGDALTEFMTYRAGKGGAAINSDEKRRIINIAFFSKGLLNVQSNEECSEESIKLLKRFAAVFEQTYTRFLDLQKAEAQAREAQIEAALERVRARTMAMRKSDDLLQVITHLSEQFQYLGFKVDVADFNIDYWEKDWNLWLWAKDVTYPHLVHVPYFDHPFFNTIRKNLDDGVDLSIAVFTKEEKDSFQRYWYEHVLTDVPEEIKKQVYSTKGFAWSVVFCKNTSLTIANFDAEPYSEEQNLILRRFANVFEQSYTRFLDLQKAEAQARESQIQLALERVRARTMAMQKSDELSETALLLFEQVQSFGVNLWSCGLNIWEKEDNESTCFVTRGGKMLPPVKLSLTENPFLQLFKTKHKEEKLWFIEMAGEEIKTLYTYIAQLRRNSTGDNHFLSGVTMPDFQRVSLVNFSHGNLMFITLEAHSEMDNIFERFGKVFEQTYTRFLDLQKAEAQGREAKIEAALERVRSRSLAMHKSDELQEVVNTVFERLKDLNIEMDSANIAIFKEGAKDFEYWIASPVQNRSAVFHMPYAGITKHLADARESGADFFMKTYSFKEKNALFQQSFQLTDFKFLDEHRKKFIMDAEGATVAIAFSKHTGVQMARYSLKSVDAADVDVLKRFSKVFEQAYIRFLDLQKAEAQTRESQIQLSLERVRARTMAMHKSEELAEVAEVLYNQLKDLGDDPERITIGIMSEDNRVITWWATDQGGSKLNIRFQATADEPTVMLKLYNSWKAKHTSLVVDLTGPELSQWVKYCREVIGVPINEEILQNRRVQTAGFFSHGCVMITSPDLPAAETINILERFAIVFGLTYRRFLDLQKAEAQAREAQIELGLERVRARAMAMQKSDELKELIGTVFTELTKLDLILTRCLIMIYDPATKGSTWWMANSEAPSDPIGLIVQYHEHPPYLAYVKAWQERNLRWQYILEGTVKKDWDDFLFVETELSQLPDFVIAGMKGPERVYLNASFNSFGNLTLATLDPLSEEHFNIMLRFARVFDLTYTRFNDLQKAEAQAKEAKIETALERIRARALAMHSSAELTEVATVLREQMRILGQIELEGCVVHLYEEDPDNIISWLAIRPDTTSVDKIVTACIKIPKDSCELAKELVASFNDKKDEYTIISAGKKLRDWRNIIFNASPELEKELGGNIPEKNFIHSSDFSGGSLIMVSLAEPSEESIYLQRRAANVFDLAYKRFVDLKKAEAQAREAQIETSLERVRSKTMAMHSSDDVTSATATMFTELERLGIENFRGGITNIHANRTQDVWSVNNLAEGKVLKAVGSFNIDAHPFWQLMYKEWEAKKDFIHYFLAGQEKEAYFKILNATQGYLPQAIEKFPDVHFQVYTFNEGAVWTNSLKPHSEEDKQVMKRFASVFSLTFRRYQDLKKAEAQAREATIEAALERVRGKAMAMHSSKDLATTIGVFYHELEGLSLTPRRCGVGLINKETHIAELSTMSSTDEGQSIELVGRLDLRGHPVLAGVYDNWLTKTEYHPILRGNEIKEYYQLLRPQMDFPDFPNDSIQYGYFFFFEEGGVYAWTEKELLEDELKIYRRFTSVLSLTYKRYKDLKDAEARTQNAIKEAALDRIRADIASMRTVEDLDRITPLIWNEFKTLNIPFIRCGVFIMDEMQQQIHTFLSTPDGKAIAAFHLPFDTPGNFSVMLQHWKEKNIYTSRWEEVDFIGIAEILVKQGEIATKDQYLSTLPKEGFFLHFLPFLQGMLYVGNMEKLNDEQIELIQHVADAFSTAYARYEDFNKLEAAKQQVENTLVHLKQTQQQLVQSEKMASLGELTAGIGHEIQNPLNFVNNFSEVNSELIGELVEEVDKGNLDEVKAIAKDIKENEEKINHHGKRADAIVKGMLQHSRASTKQKELTDINALADEYLRLAYHGLRAKDKSFNAKFETDFDNSIGKINIIPQDVGRVILNLINNAFYVVSEKNKSSKLLKGDQEYQPTVSICTKCINYSSGGGGIEISVKDNGDGIPQNIVDKIFQPFFTTKPTGQGTGLGLSLSYDIIKAHGGEIRVETMEGEGSEFVIQLPFV